MPTFDETDARILADRRAAWEAQPANFPRVGDVIRFANGTERYVSHIWRGWDEESQTATDPETIQTSDGGSFHLSGRSLFDLPGERERHHLQPRPAVEPWAALSMSGSLYRGIPAESCTLTDETRDLSVWFFHHDHTRAHNAVHATIPVRVFVSTAEAS